ncbi:MAG: UDP-3-O-acyl-N-acetylglucosamine deacetylase [Lentisphaerae bacterium]|nr:UDP-3-O-acyl-N-acetylglucosamine deacetylase [Lentisphaerota bacterium]
MQLTYPIGRLLAGDAEGARRSLERLEAQPIDDIRITDSEEAGFSDRRTTIVAPASVTGPGTFSRRAQRTLTFKPSPRPGWWIKRRDLPEQLPILVSARNVWTAQRNIVLRSGSPHNYLRMVEHIVALRMGCGVDDLLIETDSGDPPLFDRSSLDLVEALTESGVKELDAPACYVTVKEPVTIAGDRGDFITLLPAEPFQRKLRVDCAVDFASAIGRQRIVFDVNRETFRQGAGARTNATRRQLILTRTVGLLFAETRNIGYTNKNILIHGRKRYVNTPLLMHNGRSLEAVWHRATLDLLAALALIDLGRFVGTAVSYRAGHLLDTRLMTLLYLHDLLEVVGPQ